MALEREKAWPLPSIRERGYNLLPCPPPPVPFPPLPHLSLARSLAFATGTFRRPAKGLKGNGSGWDRQAEAAAGFLVCHRARPEPKAARDRVSQPAAVLREAGEGGTDEETTVEPGKKGPAGSGEGEKRTKRGRAPCLPPWPTTRSWTTNG